jgi:transposase
MQILDVGVDVSKDSVVAAQPGSMLGTISNRRTELTAWLKTLPPGSRLAMEATGRYHTLLADLADSLGFEVYVLNPKDVHYYAKGLGRRGKTDQIDAQVIARYLAKEHEQLQVYHSPSPQQRELDQLLLRRARVVALRGALRASLQDLPLVSQELAATLARMDALLLQMDQRRDVLIAACAQRQQAQQRLQSIVGVGPVVGAGLGQALERIRFRDADAFVAYTGLDPRPMDSGKKIGRRRLSKRGPAELRRLLYNAAMSAAKTKTWRPFYERQRAKGLSTTAALVVLARKIARVAWSVHRHHTTFNPSMLASGLT